MDKRNLLAQYSHDQAWSGWMKYMFTQGIMNEDGTWTMPKEKVERWTRQMNTLYVDLTEQEKKSDLAEADKMLDIFAVV